MGLDITAYSRLQYIGAHDPVDSEEGCQYDEDYNRVHVKAYAYDSFPQSFRGIPVLTTTKYGRDAVFIEGGCFAVTDATRTHRFRAGSYTGYNRWRENLQQQFNPERDPDKPFYELIWFADNEGTISADASKDLLEDFRLHFERYVPGVPEDWGYLERYKDWLRAFELGADGGLVDFH